MRPNRSPMGIVMLLIIMALLGQACGKKNDPLPPRATMPKIADLVSHSAREGIVLDWSLTVPADGVAAFKVLRSERAAGNQEACFTCPREYRFSVSVPVGDERLQRQGGQKFRYVDTHVSDGHSYRYRIVACDESGHCGDASAESAIVHALP